MFILQKINKKIKIKKNRKEHDPIWLQIPDHPYKILIIENSGSQKANALLNLINRKLYTLIKFICILRICLMQKNSF